MEKEKIKEELKKIKYYHGKFEFSMGQTTMKDHYIPLSLKLIKTIEDKYNFYNSKYNIDFLRFTLGKIPDKHLEVITICYPKDNYSRKTGRNIVKSRIKEYLKGKLDVNKFPWIYVLDRK